MEDNKLGGYKSWDVCLSPQYKVIIRFEEETELSHKSIPLSSNITTLK